MWDRSRSCYFIKERNYQMAAYPGLVQKYNENNSATDFSSCHDRPEPLMNSPEVASHSYSHSQFLIQSWLATNKTRKNRPQLHFRLKKPIYQVLHPTMELRDKNLRREGEGGGGYVQSNEILLIVREKACLRQDAEGTSLAVCKHKEVDHPADSTRSSEFDSQNELIMSTGRTHADEFASLDDDRHVEIMKPKALEVAGSRPDIPLSDSNQNRATETQLVRKKKRSRHEKVLENLKRSKGEHGTFHKKKVVIDKKSVEKISLVDPGNRSVVIEVSKGDFVQLYGKERAKRAVINGRAIVVQCFVCFEQYQVDRSAEALYCTSCDSLTHLGKGIHRRDKHISPDAVHELDRRITEQIRDHGFEEAI